MHAKKKFLAATALTASLTAGGVVGAMFGAPTLSSAQTAPEQGVERAAQPTNTPGRAGDPRPAERPARQGERSPAHHRPGEGRAGPHAHRGLALEAAAEALGVTAEELKAELRAGKSVRTVARERNVDIQRVIDAIVGAITQRAEERATAFVDGQRTAEQERASN